MATLPRLPQRHHFSQVQLAVLGELRAGPRWEGGLLTQTFRALHRRGLVDPVERGELAYRWRLSPSGARVVLALRLVPEARWWMRRHFGLDRLRGAEQVDRVVQRAPEPSPPPVA